MKPFSFIPGLELNRGFYFDIVKPLLEEHFPNLRYSASLIGYGSDVLGTDTAISMDHNWGPRCQIFLQKEDLEEYCERLDQAFRQYLPLDYKGFSTNFTDPRYDGTSTMKAVSSGPVNHLIQIDNIEGFFSYALNCPHLGNFSEADWLGFSDQKLIELVSGEVFEDGLGLLNPIREKLRFWPRDILLLRMAALWRMIENDEPSVGRCRDTGDLVGQKIIAARTVENYLKICFYLEERYIPYIKWFGTLFRRLSCAADILPLAERVLNAQAGSDTENALAELGEAVVALHNRTGRFPKLDNTVRDFFGRPYKVIFAETAVTALMNAVQDPVLKNLKPERIALDLKVGGDDMGADPAFRRLAMGEL